MRPNNERSRRLIIILWVFTGCAVLSGISHFMQFQLLKRISQGEYSMQEVTSNDLRQLVFAALETVVYIVAIILFIQWFRRAYFNLHQISNNLSYSEGWAAGAWFVPFMNLARPFSIMKEMMFVAESKLIAARLVSENDSRRKSVGWWWTFWIVISVAASINNRIQMNSADVYTLINTSLVDVIISLLYIPLTLVTVKMIRLYAELEEKLPQLDGVENAKIDNPDLLDAL